MGTQRGLSELPLLPVRGELHSVPVYRFRDCQFGYKAGGSQGLWRRADNPRLCGIQFYTEMESRRATRWYGRIPL
jgi:hypothetical protein